MFTTDFISFFQDLAANNNRDWFHANKKRYENSVKKPFNTFIAALIERYEAEGLEMHGIEPKHCIFRIHRDIRFSKDKTPYKLQMSAVVSPSGRKHMEDSRGSYIEINPEYLRIYGGAYAPQKEHLYNIRKKIASDITNFQKLITNKKFTTTFGEIQGEKNKRIPKEFKEKAVIAPIIANKQFYYYADLGIDNLTAPNLVDKIIAHYHIQKPINNYLYEAMKG